MPEMRRADTPTELYSAAVEVYSAAVEVADHVPEPKPSDARPAIAPPGQPEDELVGTTLSGTYQVLRVLGEGGMGRVYEAQHTRIAGKRCAIKVLHIAFARRDDVRARFQREAEAAASINHPNVVGVYDVNVLPDGRPFLVSELLEGRELGAYLDERGRMSPAEAVAVVRQVCDALQAAHAQGVIHRDVKPENVFLTGTPERLVVKVLDFGISRLDGQGGQTLTRTGVVMGTPSYMAPEQARGERVDHRTDMYATGAILYRGLTGRLPFDRPDTMATLAAVLTEEPARLRALAPDISESLELVVQRAMARDADDRYQQMDELSAALAPFDVLRRAQARPAQESESSPAGSAAARQAQQARGARTRLTMLLLAAGLGVLCGAIGLLAACIQLLQRGSSRELSGIEALLVMAAVSAALSTPMLLAARKLMRQIWDNTAKVMELLAGLRGPVLVGLASSGILALVARVVEPVLLRNSVALSWPVWGVLIPTVGGVAALAVAVSQSAHPDGVLGRIAQPRGLAVGAGAFSLLVLLALMLREPPRGVLAGEQADGPANGSASVDADRSKDAADDQAGGEPGSSARGRDRVALSSADAEQLLAQLGSQQRRNDLTASLSTLQALSGAPPELLNEPRVRKLIADVAVRAYFTKGPSSQRMTSILLDKMDAAGREVLFELMVTRGGTAAARTAKELLGEPKVQAQCSDDLRIAYALRVSASCAAKLALVPRAASEGGPLALRELNILRACGGGGCCPSKSEDTAVKNAISKVTQRVR